MTVQGRARSAAETAPGSNSRDRAWKPLTQRRDDLPQAPGGLQRAGLVLTGAISSRLEVGDGTDRVRCDGGFAADIDLHQAFA